MTMPKAIALLVLSGLIMAAGVALVFVRIDQGRVDSSINDRNVGARAGDERATPTGSNGFSNGQANRVLPETAATITATVRTAEAVQTPPAQPTAGPAGRGGGVGEPFEVNGVRHTGHQVAGPEPARFLSTTGGKRRGAVEITPEALDGPSPYSFSRFRIRDVDG